MILFKNFMYKNCTLNAVIIVRYNMILYVMALNYNIFAIR